MNSTKNLSRRAGLLYVLVSRSQGTESSLGSFDKGWRTSHPSFLFGRKKRGKENPIGLLPASSSRCQPRSPVLRGRGRVPPPVPSPSDECQCSH
jgi:hypothetical protein